MLAPVDPSKPYSTTRAGTATILGDPERIVETSWKTQIILVPPEDPKDGLSDADNRARQSADAGDGAIRIAMVAVARESRVFLEAILATAVA